MAPIDSHNRPQQLSLFGRVGLSHLSITDLNKLYASEEGMFRRYFLPLIPEDLVALLYSSKRNVRPAKYAIAHVAGLFLAEIKGLTEKEFLDQLPWSIKLLHAVGIDEWNSDIDYGSRTFTDLYQRINAFNREHPGRDILHEITHRINYAIAEKMNLFQDSYDEYYKLAMRLDSTMIDSTALQRTRLEIVTIINLRLLREMCKNGTVIPKEMTHYLEKHYLHSVTYYKGTEYEYDKEYEQIIKESKDNSVLIVRAAQHTLEFINQLTKKKKEESKAKVEEASNSFKFNESDRKSIISYHRLYVAVAESETLKTYCEKSAYRNTERYADFMRMVNEQTFTNEDMHLTPKANDQISPESMQSPFDPDATYRYKAGKSYRGYVGMIVSIFDKQGNSCVVEDWLQKNTYPDQRLMEDFHNLHDSRLNCTQGKRGMITCDAGFISIELNQISDKQYGWDTYCAGVHGNPPNLIFSEFELSEDGKMVLKCPTGGIPLSSYSNGIITARFKDKRCQNCEHASDCGATITGKTPSIGSSFVKVSKSKVAAALCLKMLRSEDRERVIEYINKRNAIEGDNSVLKRKYHIHNRTRSGIQAARHALYIANSSSNWRKYYKFLKSKR